jgi:hypothetical protein
LLYHARLEFADVLKCALLKYGVHRRIIVGKKLRQLRAERCLSIFMCESRIHTGIGLFVPFDT